MKMMKRMVLGAAIAALGLTASAGAPVYVNSTKALQNAVNAAEDGAMIVLTADAKDCGLTLPSGLNNIVIDLNGHSLLGSGGSGYYLLLTHKNNLTIMNSSTVTANITGACLSVYDSSTVSLRGKINVEYPNVYKSSALYVDDSNVSLGKNLGLGSVNNRYQSAGTAADFATAIDNAAAGAVIKLTANITASGVTLNSGKDFNIDLNGKTLNLNQTHFYVKSGATLGLLDSAGGGKVTNGKSGYGGFVEINGGSFNMYAGTIDGCTSDGKEGGAAYMWGGAFNMYGGVIQNCSSTGSGSCIYAQASSMINIYNGAKITGCKSGRYGTIMVLASGGQSPVVDLNGCEISNNSASWGSGLFVQDSSTVNIVDTIINGQLRINSGTVTASGYCTITSFSGASYSNNGTKSKITFDFQSGSGGTASVDPATYGQAMPAATMPTRTGYTFLGYYDATSGGTQYYKADGTSARNWDKVVAAATLYARWSENTATLSYNANGHGTAPTAVTMKYTAACNAAAALTGVTGYTFSKWNTKADGTGTSYNANAQVKAANVDPTATTLYAIWTANAYTVAFDGNGATGGSASVTATYGEAMPAATMPTKTGYTFAGYFDASGKQYYNADGTSAANWDKAANTTLYAQWTLNYVSVTLTAGEGEGYGFAVSNLTTGAEIQVGEDGQYVLPAGAKVGIYAVAKDGYVILAANPLIIEKVDENTRNIVDSDLPRPTVSKPGSGDEPEKVIEKVKGDNGETYTAVLENKSETGEEVENPVRAMSVEGLGEVASSKKTDVTLSVTPKDVKSVDQDVAEKIDSKLKEASEGKGFDSVAYVDLSVSFDAVKQENCELESVITLHIPWPVRTGGSYGVVRMHNDEPQMIPQGEGKAVDGEFFTVDFEKREIVLRVKKFCDYAVAETPPGVKVGENAYAVVEDGVCEIYGTGSATNFPATFDRKSVTSATIGEGVTEIGARFFKDFRKMKRIEGGAGLVRFGEKAFYRCLDLEEINIANPDFEVSSLENAVVYQMAINAKGEFYMVPKVTVAGYTETLYGKRALTDAEWTQIGALKEQNLEALKAEGVYHFFQTRLVKGVAQ